MKRYWLFISDQYYPSGGMCDFVGDYDTIEEAKEVSKPIHGKDMQYTAYHILDIQDRIIVEEYDRNKDEGSEYSYNIQIEELYGWDDRLNNK